MATTFYQFQDGNELKQGNVLVGLSRDASDATNEKYDFPGTGFKDANGNYLLSYSTTSISGPNASNYPTLRSVALGGEVVQFGCNGPEANISVELISKGSGTLYLSSGSGNVVINNSSPLHGVSDDVTLSGTSNAHLYVPTQYAVKSYVDSYVSGVVYSVSGVPGRITIAGTPANPIVDIDSTYVGQSSITTLGTITTGSWNGSVISSAFGGTGVNNGGRTITIAGNLATVGAFASIFNFTGATNVTFPTSGTLATTTGSISSANNIAGGTTNDIVYQTAAGTTGFIPETANGVLVYNGSGVPSSSTTLPSGLSATNLNLTTPALGTPSAGSLTNCTGLPIATGVSGLGAGVATFLATPTSANLAAAVTNETGTGALVFATSPTLVTPLLGTPTSGVLTNCTGLPVSTGISGLGTNVATFLATPTSANLLAAVTDETGTGALVFATSPSLVTPILGTPTSGTLTNCTGLPISTGVSGLATGIATFLATPTSANLAAAVTNETGTGALVFATSPTLVTPILGTPASGTLTNCTGLPISTGISGLGTGVATFLATPSSANLLTALTDKTGTGVSVFGTSPTFTTQITTPTVVRTGATDTNTKFTANSGSAFTIDPANGPYQEITLTANTTLTLAANPGSTVEREFIVNLIQDATGSRTVAWANIAFATNGGAAPTIPSAPGSMTTISIVGSSLGWKGYYDNGMGLTGGATPGAGMIGEILYAEVTAGSAVSCTNSVVGVLTSVNFTPGNWLVSANLTFSGSAITATDLQAFIGTAAGTSTAGQSTRNTSYVTPFNFSANDRGTASIGPYSFPIATSGTLYLKARAAFSAGSCAMYGSITLVRIS